MEHLLSVQFEAIVCASCVHAFSPLQVPPWSDGCCHPPNQRFFLWLSMASQVGHSPQVLWEPPTPSRASPSHFPHSVPAHLPPLFYALSPDFPFFCTEGSPSTERISNSQKATWNPVWDKWMVTRDTQSAVRCVPGSWSVRRLQGIGPKTGVLSRHGEVAVKLQTWLGQVLVSR